LIRRNDRFPARGDYAPTRPGALAAAKGDVMDHVTPEIVAPREAVAPRALNHIVLNVRDIEESHRFWTELIGFQHVGTEKPRPDRPNPPNFRFYSCDHGEGRLSHHDLALVENKNLPPPPADWDMVGMNMAINHVAVLLPNREAW
jgi:catechol 2,3-dioxygenase